VGGQEGGGTIVQSTPKAEAMGSALFFSFSVGLLSFFAIRWTFACLLLVLVGARAIR
jgi:hypothetical protein